MTQFKKDGTTPVATNPWQETLVQLEKQASQLVGQQYTVKVRTVEEGIEALRAPQAKLTSDAPRPFVIKREIQATTSAPTVVAFGPKSTPKKVD